MKKVNPFICALLFIFLSCAVTEQTILDTSPKIMENPVYSIPADSLQTRQIISHIQSSPEYILAGVTVKEEGQYLLKLSVEEAMEMGISQKDFEQYCIALEDLNRD